MSVGQQKLKVTASFGQSSLEQLGWNVPSLRQLHCFNLNLPPDKLMASHQRSHVKTLDRSRKQTQLLQTVKISNLCLYGVQRKNVLFLMKKQLIHSFLQGRCVQVQQCFLIHSWIKQCCCQFKTPSSTSPQWEKNNNLKLPSSCGRLENRQFTTFLGERGYECVGWKNKQKKIMFHHPSRKHNEEKQLRKERLTWHTSCQGGNTGGGGRETSRHSFLPLNSRP